MDRRAFIFGIVGGLLAAQLAAEAQRAAKVYRMGLLDYGASDPARQASWNAFRQQMRKLGYVEGQNVRFEPAGLMAMTIKSTRLPPSSSASRCTSSSRDERTPRLLRSGPPRPSPL
jgi:hypothetical protein